MGHPCFDLTVSPSFLVSWDYIFTSCVYLGLSFYQISDSSFFLVRLDDPHGRIHLLRSDYGSKPPHFGAIPFESAALGSSRVFWTNCGIFVALWAEAFTFVWSEYFAWWNAVPFLQMDMADTINSFFGEGFFFFFGEGGCFFGCQTAKASFSLWWKKGWMWMR